MESRGYKVSIATNRRKGEREVRRGNDETIGQLGTQRNGNSARREVDGDTRWEGGVPRV